LLGGI